MANEIGEVKGINGSSMALNNQPNLGGEKPSAKGGNASPGGTHPGRCGGDKTPVPKA